MSYSRFRTPQLRQSAIITDIESAVTRGNIDRLKRIIDETGFNIRLLEQDRLLSFSTISGNLKMVSELLKMGLVPDISEIASVLSIGLRNLADLGNVDRIHGTETYANRVYPALKAFLLLLAQPGAKPYLRDIRELNPKRIYAYLSNPDNRSTLIAALAEVNELVPLAKEKSATNNGAYLIREYLVRAGVENVPELISEAVKSSFAAMRRAHALSNRNESTYSAATEGGAAAAAAEGGAPAAAAAPLRRVAIDGTDIKFGDGKCYFFGNTYLGRLVEISGTKGFRAEPYLHFEKGQIINMFNKFLVVPCRTNGGRRRATRRKSRKGRK